MTTNETLAEEHMRRVHGDGSPCLDGCDAAPLRRLTPTVTRSPGAGPTTPCDCTEPYSVHVEPVTRTARRRISQVDAYGHPLAGSREVWRCEHGREMTWDDARGSYVIPRG